MTVAQRRALTTLWPRYGLDAGGPLDLDRIFGRPAEKHLEIGFGMGEALLEMAQTHPEHDYLGIDVHLPGVGRVLLQLERLQLTNVRLFCGDAVAILQSCFQSNCLDGVYIFFPDPWPKKRQQKRRLVHAPFIELVTRCLKSGGYLQLATDWETYAQHMLTVLEACPLLVNCAGEGCFITRPLERPVTRFEQRGQKLGHCVWDLWYRRI